MRNTTRRMTSPRIEHSHAARVHRLALPFLALLLLSIASSGAHASDVSGTISGVEANGRVRIELPRGTVARPGDEVRIETVIPGIGAVEIKNRWRVTIVGEGFVLADPVGQAAGTPQAGYTAFVQVGAAGPTTAGSPAGSRQGEELSEPEIAGLRKAAEAGETFAILTLGAHFAAPPDKPRNLEQALHWYRTAANKGDPNAMTSLGLLLQRHRKNDPEAAQWLEKAAANGEASAIYVLARLRAEGRGVAKDEVGAVRLLRQAAEKEDALAANELGNMYFRGRGVQQDFVEAVHWYRKSAEAGFTNAMMRLSGLYNNGVGIAKNPAEALRWSLKAAESGFPYGMFEAGMLYLTGAGGSKNPGEARKWFEKAAALGEGDAMYGLALLYDKGDGVSANAAVAADWMVKALRARSPNAADHIMTNPASWSEAFRRELQKKLAEQGLYQGRIDGDIGTGSRRAIAETVKRGT